jgi:dynein heavy chain
VAEANYGGRVTDDKDRRLITVLLKQFYTKDILDDNYRFVPSHKNYYVPSGEGDLNSFKDYIETLPLNDPPEIYGLHANAEISAAINETNNLCSAVLSLLPRTLGGGGASIEEIIKEKCLNFLGRIPKPFDVELAAKLHPNKYKESMNTVLQ